MCHSCSAIQGFVTARDWLAHKHSKGDIPGTFSTARGHPWMARMSMQFWTHVSGKIIGFLRKEFPLRNRIGIRPNFKVEAMDGTELNY